MSGTFTTTQLIEFLAQFPADIPVYMGDGPEGQETAFYEVRGGYVETENDNGPECIITGSYL